MATYKCVHCADIRPETEVNGDLLECGACGLFSRTDIPLNSGIEPSVLVLSYAAIRDRLRQEPAMTTATEVQQRRIYVADVSFLLRALGEYHGS